MKCFFLFFIGIIFISSCSKGKITKEDFVVLVDINKVKELSLFELFSEIDIIPLETTDKSILNSKHFRFIVNNDKFYYLDRKQNSLFIFDNQGHFVKKISKQGGDLENILF